ncbi:MAG: bifunctional diaminohydroxyphosphoribosylaminopyrimidine deaminase/5-amino-6-(5-phosphoribosylamino)uracil reductase RibD [Crocinitomicaceae bacterium]|jgi:diaminohydroxyphosphoribosylaminopyrimidine deaminase/5-amino-6-(5-phosphoribosylamino)uracil reductase|nr:bifunctional diaminohydroxyphosphoribosylaminopyrimidine deaminase/5-amino-6-(5-phosphoribosylamino)uracil reductase RibD [Crocinitomicaceae bacterium]MDG1350796.1 bifunctional diaminohydroxyphosphoribosylaminopyrimidine deaminase/5-amino-6-(5-phosphoribosylamino)uracil reductase RibD [Crocinitomicaceae bacterium]
MSAEIYMQRCIDLARKGIRSVAPNPMVGCVLVVNNKIIGEGYHQFFGGPHAEVNAINNVLNTKALKKATLYVSLEPCSHMGKTAPCADLIIKKGIQNVVIGTRDPNPLVGGKGIEKLKNAGIEVEEGVLQDQCLELNKRFFTFHEKRRPYVILKWAQTLDGFLDRIREDNKQEVNWISAPETKTLVHKWRSEEQSILVGRNTILNDNPSLTVREYGGTNPIRLVIDSQLQISGSLNVYSEDAPTIVFNRLKDATEKNIEFVKIKETSTKNILDELYKRGIQSVFVEGGSRTLQYFIIDNVWDEARVIVGRKSFKEGYKAPVINRIPIKTIPFGKDTVHYFKRK